MQEGQDVFETIVGDFLEHEYAVVTGFVADDVIQLLNANLRHLLAAGKMKSAGIGQHNQFRQNQDVRRDLISWIDEQEGNASELHYFNIVRNLILYLNETCYTGLKSMECHYAWYNTGSFYKKHMDQFHSDSGRKYSIVLYLNDHWTEKDGGQLVLCKGKNEIRILPEGGRFVFFQSDVIEHEVLPATKPRLSIAGWLKDIY